MSRARAVRPSHSFLLLAIPIGALVLLLVVPLALIVLNSLVRGEPGQVGGWPLTLGIYADIVTDPRNARIMARTVILALAATVLASIVSYPIALVIVTSKSRAVRALYTIAALSPLLISVVLRTFGWQVLLGSGGPVARLLTDAFGPRWLMGLVGTKIASVVGLTHLLVPFILLGLLPVLDRIDRNIVYAAESLGATRFDVFWRVILPLSRPGLLAGGVIGFALGCTAYVTPALLGGPRNQVFSSLIFDSNFVAFDWNSGAALSIVLLMVVVLAGFFIGKYGRFRQRQETRGTHKGSSTPCRDRDRRQGVLGKSEVT